MNQPITIENLESLRSRLVAYANRLTKNEADSEEAVNMGLEKAWLHKDKFRGDSNFSTYCHTIVRNEVLMSIRKNRIRMLKEVSLDAPKRGVIEEREFLVAEQFDSGVNIEAGLQAREKMEAAIAVIMTLSSRQRRAILELVNANGNYSKASRKLGISRAAFKSRIHLARKEIREKAFC